MTRDELAAVFAAALARKREHRRNVYTTYTDTEELQARLDGRTLPKVGIYAPEFRDAESAAEWWDDRILERNSSHWGDPAVPALFAVAAAARDGGATAAREAVRAAKRLDPAVAWTVFRNLEAWQKHRDAARFGADQLVGQVLAEWRRLKLPAEDPAARQQPERRRRRWETTEAEATA